MDIRLLEYFLAVAKHGNITRAAEQLHITQPTISRQLMDLEQAVGTPLLIRGKRQVTLTEAGVLFQQRAEEIVSLMEKAMRDITDQEDLLGGTVAIGCVETWGVVMRKDDPLAEKERITKEDVLTIPLILPRREIVQDHIAGWFGVDWSQLNVFAGHNLLNNAALLAEAGLGYVICVRGGIVFPESCNPYWCYCYLSA